MPAIDLEKLPPMSVEEFTKWQRRQERLYELVDGRPKLPLKTMTGATVAHDTVTGNVFASLHHLLRGSPCRPHTDDIAIRIPAGNLRRPDVLVDCGEAHPSDMIAAEPVLVVEVLSPSTMSLDRIHKLDEYRTVPCLSAILLVDTEAPHVTLYRRGSESKDWQRHIFEGLEARLVLPRFGGLDGLDVSLALADIYDGVSFDPPAPAGGGA